jgi:hypothetical protein
MPSIDMHRLNAAAAALLAALLIAATPLALHAQDTSPPSVARPHGTSVASSPLAPTSSAPATAATWEYGIYTHYLGAAKRWAGPDGRVVEHGNLNEFLEALGARPDEIPEKYASEERYNATVLNLLARDRWEVVNCQFVVRSRSDLYTCYLKRPVVKGSEGSSGGT